MVSELMLLGFISLLLTVFQNGIIHICVNEGLVLHLLPCKLPSESESEGEPSSNSTETTSHFRRLLDEGSKVTGYCAAKVTRLPFLIRKDVHAMSVRICFYM